MTCIGRGVAVLVEKPLADSIAEGRRMVEAADFRATNRPRELYDFVDLCRRAARQ
jgi:hypothetical protein